MSYDRRTVTVSWRGRRVDVELIGIDDSGHELEIGAAQAWHRLRIAAEADGLKLRARTAFRSREFQADLRARYERYSEYRQRLEAWEAGGKAGPEPAKVPFAALAAKPGRSAHEVGNAVDVDGAKLVESSTGPVLSKIAEWIRANAKKHGWLLTVKSEPWHIEWEFGQSLVVA
jgi:LAS superfamily LD-carboxypeptidase LdcB